MPTAKKDKKTLNKATKKAAPEEVKETVVDIDLVEPSEEEDIHAEEELDPEIIEALKLKNKKPKKAPHETDYIPELERGEIDLDFKIDEDY